MADLKNKLAAKTDEVKVAKTDGNTIEGLIARMQPEIQKALPKHLTPERFARIALTSIRLNPDLLKCNQASLLGALMQSAQLGLEPNMLGQAYLIPRWNSKLGSTECQFQIGYKGLIELVRRSGYIKTIEAREVCENDEFDYSFGMDAVLKHKPCVKGSRGDVYCYYAIAKTINDDYIYHVMSKEDVTRIRDKYAKGFNAETSPWRTEFDGMAKKTVLKQLVKMLPLSPEIMHEVAQDETVKKEIKPDMVNEVLDSTTSVSEEVLGMSTTIDVEYEENFEGTPLE